MKQTKATTIRRDVLFGAVCLVLTLLSVAPSFDELLIQADPGTQLTKGQQILHGHHPFIEVDNSTYGPAIFYISALAQSLYQDNRLLPEIVWILLVQLSSFVVILSVLRHHLRPRWLFFGFLLVQLLAFPRFHKYFVVLPMALITFAAHRVSDNRLRYPGIICGLASGVALLFRLDLGAFVFVACALAISQRPVDSSGVRLRELALQALTTSSVLAPWLLFLTWHGSPLEIVRQTLLNARMVSEGLSLVPARVRVGESLASANNTRAILFLVAVVLPLAGLFTSWVTFRQRRRHPKSSVPRGHQVLAAVTLYSLLASVAALYRPDLPHIKQALVGSLFVGFLAVGIASQRWVWCRERPRHFAAAGMVCCSLLAAALLPSTTLSRHRLATNTLIQTVDSWRWSARQGLERLALAEPGGRSPRTLQERLATTLLKVQDLTQPGEPVLFLPFLAQAYFFAERDFETPFGWFVPGRFRHADSTNRFLNRLGRTRVLVDQHRHGFDARPERTPRVYARETMEYLYRHYAIREVVDPFVILQRPPLGVDATASGHPALSPATSPPPDPDEALSACETIGYRLVKTNTFQVDDEPRPMPKGGGLLLSFQSCGLERKSCTASRIWLLSDNRAYDAELFGMTTRQSAQPWRGKRPWWLLDTTSVPAGNYSVHLEVATPCPLTDGGRLLPTKARIEIEGDW